MGLCTSDVSLTVVCLRLHLLFRGEPSFRRTHLLVLVIHLRSDWLQLSAHPCNAAPWEAGLISRCSCVTDHTVCWEIEVLSNKQLSKEKEVCLQAQQDLPTAARDPFVHRPHTAGCLTQFSTWTSKPKHAACVSPILVWICHFIWM